MDKGLYMERMWHFAVANTNFGIHYNKIFKKEYLPSRIRYNQFFFWIAFWGGCYGLLSYKAGGGMLCPQEGTTGEKELGLRRYYTTDRSCVNIIARMLNKSGASSHASK